jgi:hypothetical protein
MRKTIAVSFLVLTSACAVIAQDRGWPRQITRSASALVCYRPPVDNCSDFQSLDWRSGILEAVKICRA